MCFFGMCFLEIQPYVNYVLKWYKVEFPTNTHRENTEADTDLGRFVNKSLSEQGHNDMWKNMLFVDGQLVTQGI